MATKTTKNADGELSAEQLYPKLATDIEVILAGLRPLCVSDQRPDPKFKPDPSDPEAKAGQVDTDPPTDTMGQCRLTARELKTKAKADAKKYSGRYVKATGIDDVAKLFTTARRQLQKLVDELAGAAVVVRSEEATAKADRAAYAERNKGRLVEQERLLARQVARQQRRLQELRAATGTR